MPLGAILQTAGGAALVVLAYMTAWFVVALVTKRNDLADIAWGPGFILIAAWLLVRGGGPLSDRQVVATVLVAIWGLRLAWQIGRRNLRRGHGEDARYAEWRRTWGRWFVPRSYLQVFLLQGALMLLIAAPLLVLGSTKGSRLGVTAVLGIVVWVVGFVFEALGDAQLARFLRDPANKGRTMTSGLWSLTRHPNYFGESLMWWGIAVIALGVRLGWIGLIGPVTITVLLIWVSGIPMAEARRAGNPEWEAYKARTSPFIPWPPRKVRGQSHRPA